MYIYHVNVDDSIDPDCLHYNGRNLEAKDSAKFDEWLGIHGHQIFLVSDYKLYFTEFAKK